MLRNLTLSVLRYEKVKTTEAKAKEVRGFVDQMINLGKDGSLAARRRAIAWLPEAAIVNKVFTDLAPRYPDRRSGYARLVRLAPRVGDSAPAMIIELLPAVADEPPAEEPKPRKRLALPGRAKKAAAPTPAKATKKPAAKKAVKKAAKA
ncbi:MAG: 50S ribosomal protein L17 [Chloroflexi bacterium]|nr:50S ribosomal protein L17 [Chloroflexota bacterium]